MRTYYRFWAAAAAVLILCAGCRPEDNRLVAAPVDSQSRTDSAVAFPDFQVKTLDGQTAALSQYRGKVVILDLFATWCPPCRMEIPQFVALQKQYADRLTVVGLSYDQGSAEPVKKFMQDMKINYAVYWGSQEIANFVGLRGIPQTLVLDPEGRVRQSYIGFTPQSTFEQAILALSPTPAPPAAQKP
jgi:thiol-disulfide isomerase/thioredoxin